MSHESMNLSQFVFHQQKNAHVIRCIHFLVIKVCRKLIQNLVYANKHVNSFIY